MARRVFFSFEYKHDVWRTNPVRNSWVMKGSSAGFVDAAEYEKVERQGKAAIRQWIDNQLKGTSVTVVLFGRYTCKSYWVNYEITQSKNRGNGLLGIDISGIKNFSGKTTTCCGSIPGYPFYSWTTQNGFDNIGKWIEAAAKKAGR